jgi:23S rRNA G2069 N7-methylase RlmK/C1962 C5-methylase RlmI
MNRYDVIVIDPPWPMKFIKRKVRPNQVQLAYRTMTLEEIEFHVGEQLNQLCADDCHVFL